MTEDRTALRALLERALMLEQNDEWAVTRRYMSLETIESLCDDQTLDVAKLAAI